MVVKSGAVYVRRRVVAGSVVLLVLSLVVLGVAGATRTWGSAPSSSARAESGAAASSPAAPVSASVPVPVAPSPPRPRGAPGSSAVTELVRVRRLTGDLTPKSVVASPRGQVFAQNMMYRHTVTVFGADGNRVRTIRDSVTLADFGVPGHPGTSKGAPVEVAFSPDGRTAWVTNYAMYGEGFLPEGQDSCTSAAGQSRSFVYEIDTTSYVVKRVVEVGVVPKYIAVSPDGRRVLVSNWCSMDLSVIDSRSASVVATIPLGGRNPRGIAIAPDGRTAYVALMGSGTVVAVDLGARTVRDFARPGSGPRHVVISRDGGRLFVTNNTSGTVSEVDRSTGRTLRSVRVGVEPRSMVMSADGGALYVVSYESSTVTKLRTRDLTVLDTVSTDYHPIGITYEPTRKTVWVACYGGSILLYDDSRRPPA